LEKIIDNLSVVEILRERIEIRDFPGYENVNIKFLELKKIIEKEEKSWKSALSNIKGVYLISDKNSGKLYVGAAYGEKAFWNRWTDYVRTMTGGNKELEKILHDNSIEYVKNFNFSILEIHSKLTDDNFIQEREKYWKKILLTRKFGYNKN